MQTQLESVANDIISQQDEADAAEKRLDALVQDIIECTAKETGGALRNELEVLQTRCRRAENAFLDLYRKVIQVPDPQPALASAQTLCKLAAHNGLSPDDDVKPVADNAPMSTGELHIKLSDKDKKIAQLQEELSHRYRNANERHSDGAPANGYERGLEALQRFANGDGLRFAQSNERADMIAAEETVRSQIDDLLAPRLRALGEVPLDTACVARECKAQMALYNIGQRIFAKTVLSQSQGCLSELLAKQKPWPRLTQRGRESYRRIAAWLCDRDAMSILIQLVRRRNAESTPLNNDDISPMEISALVAGDEITFDTVPPTFTLRRAIGGASHRWQHDDIPKDKIREIYERELAKLRAAGNERTSLARERLARESPVHDTRPIRSSLASARAQLPPIAQQQIDAIGEIDTERMVAEVRDLLAVHAISQKIFGEHVLGLSQGSVSDLLARPKPWASLTSKGREPFVRMLLFLQDREASIARLNDIKSAPWRDEDSTSPSPSIREANFEPPSSRVPMKRGCNMFNGRTVGAPSSASPLAMTRNGDDNSGHLDLTTQAVLGCQDEIDPIEVAAAVREQLQTHGIGQKVFGERVLGVSQGTVSDLLSKTKPWHALSTRGREPYIRMHLWLSAPEEKRLRAITDGPNLIHILQAERGSNMYGHSTRHAITMTRPNKGVEDLFGAACLFGTKRDFDADSGDSPTKKISRTLVTDEQKTAMRYAFAQNAYPSARMLERIAECVGLSTRTVTNWFYNQRCRGKLHTTSMEAERVPTEFLKRQYAPLVAMFESASTDEHSYSGGIELANASDNSISSEAAMALPPRQPSKTLDNILAKIRAVKQQQYA